MRLAAAWRNEVLRDASRERAVRNGTSQAGIEIVSSSDRLVGRQDAGRQVRWARVQRSVRNCQTASSDHCRAGRTRRRSSAPNCRSWRSRPGSSRPVSLPASKNPIPPLLMFGTTVRSMTNHSSTDGVSSIMFLARATDASDRYEQYSRACMHC
jgi:hypothetical protein